MDGMGRMGKMAEQEKGRIGKTISIGDAVSGGGIDGIARRRSPLIGERFSLQRVQELVDLRG